MSSTNLGGTYINEDGEVIIGQREKKRKMHGKPTPMDQNKRLVKMEKKKFEKEKKASLFKTTTAH